MNLRKSEFVVVALIAFFYTYPIAAAGVPLKALQTCLSDNVDTDSGVLSLSNVQLETSTSGDNLDPHRVTSSTWAIECEGEVAKALWDTLYAYSGDKTFPWKNDKNETLEAMQIGKPETSPGSECNRVIKEADGRPPNQDLYYCVIYLDLTDAILEGMR